MGQQEGLVPSGTSQDHLLAWSYRPFSSFRLGEMHGAGLFHHVLPYRHAGKLTFPLCVSCMTEEMSKPSHGFATPTRRDLVHSRTPQGYWEGIHSRLRTRSVAFPDHSQRALQRLHEHVAQDQGRGQQVAKSPGWQSPEMSTTLGRLQRQRGSNRTRKRSRKTPDCVCWPRWC